MMSVFEKLAKVQAELKAPKSQYNSFGHYKYRSCEDILEAAKPLCIAQGAVLTLCDDIVLVGERFYVRANATFTDVETGDSIHNCAFAREDEVKKGMDGSQVTGTASSYARKYCLNGLFCIDDTKDADTDEHHNEAENRAKKKKEDEEKAKKANKPANTSKIEEALGGTVQPLWVRKNANGKTEVYIEKYGKYCELEGMSKEWLNALTNNPNYAPAHNEARSLLAGVKK